MAGLSLHGRLHRSGAAPILARPGVVLPRPEKPAPEVVSSACARTPCPAIEGSDGVTGPRGQSPCPSSRPRGGRAGGYGRAGDGFRTGARSRRHRQVDADKDREASLTGATALCGSRGISDLGPDRERLRADGSVLGSRKVIAVKVEEVVDLVVGGEEPLRLAG